MKMFEKICELTDRQTDRGRRSGHLERKELSDKGQTDIQMDRWMKEQSDVLYLGGR